MAIAAAFARENGAILRAIQHGDPITLARLDARLRAVLVGALAQAVLDRLLSVEVDFAPEERETLASTWASAYTFALVRDLNETSRALLQEAVAAYMRTPGMTRAELAQKLTAAFGPRRAELIAITEITRAASAATNITQRRLAASGVSMVRVWRTNNDARVCPVCGPLNGKDETAWQRRYPDGPPAHPRCRCGTTLRRSNG